MTEPAPREDDVLIVSASMNTTELERRLGDRYPEASIGTEDLVGLFTATCEYYYAKEKQPALFDRGRASIQPPRPEELKRSLIPQVDHVAYEVEVDGMWLPQSKAMGRHLGWPFPLPRQRIQTGQPQVRQAVQEGLLRDRS